VDATLDDHKLPKCYGNLNGSRICTGRSEFSDVIHPEFVFDANKDRGGENDNILSCVWSNHFPHAHPLYSSSPRRQQQEHQSSSENPRIAEIFAQISANTANLSNKVAQTSIC